MSAKKTAFYGMFLALALTGSPTSSALTFPTCFLAMALPNI